MAKDKITLYTPSNTGLIFHRAKHKEVRLIKGPVGSGKSVACVNEVFDLMCKQWSVDGVRKSRWAIIRKTVPELKSTTIKTWIDWYGHLTEMKYGSPITGQVSVPLEDGTIVEGEILFISQPDAASIENLKSLELTGAFINEASEIAKASFDLLTSRIKRYPAKRDGGANWYGVLMDTNSFDETHWLHDTFYKELPETYGLYDQPPALIRKKDDQGKIYYVQHPLAENIENLDVGIDYYLGMIHGKSKAFVDVIIMNQIGSCVEGNYVYVNEYEPTLEGNHTQQIFDPKDPVLIWTHDQNFSPMSSAIIQHKNGIDYVVDEIVLDHAGPVQVAQEFVERYSDYRGEIRIYGDKYGRQGEIHGLDSYYSIIKQVLNDHGFHMVTVLALTKNPLVKDCQDSLKARMCDAYDQRAFKVNPEKAPTTDTGFQRVALKEGSVYKELENNRYQHVTTACRYYTYSVYGTPNDDIRIQTTQLIR